MVDFWHFFAICILYLVFCLCICVFLSFLEQQFLSISASKYSFDDDYDGSGGRTQRDCLSLAAPNCRVSLTEWTSGASGVNEPQEDLDILTDEDLWGQIRNTKQVFTSLYSGIGSVRQPRHTWTEELSPVSSPGKHLPEVIDLHCQQGESSRVTSARWAEPNNPSVINKLPAPPPLLSSL